MAEGARPMSDEQKLALVERGINALLALGIYQNSTEATPVLHGLMRHLGIERGVEIHDLPLWYMKPREVRLTFLPEQPQ